MHESFHNPPTVSIGMPVFNGAATIAQAICSILNQTFDDWELLIIDDGSQDKTFEIAASFSDPRIIVIQGENKGLPVRLNECVNRARGRFFARMDQDDVAYPGRLKRQADFLESHAEVDLVAGWMVVFRDDGRAFGARRSPLTHEQICAHPWRGVHMAHPTWMGKAEWFRRNPYCADLPLVQDQELLIRTYRNSRFAAVPEIVLGYRENSLSVRKLLRTRGDACKMMIRLAIEQRKFASGVRNIAVLLAKGMVDAIAVYSGLNYCILRHRAETILPVEEREWRSVWQAVWSATDTCRIESSGLDANHSVG